MSYRARDDLYSHILTKDEVKRLIRLWKSGWTLKDMASEFEVHPNTVSNIIDRYVRDSRREQDATD